MSNTQRWLSVVFALILMIGFFLWREQTREALVRKTDEANADGATEMTPTHVRLKSGAPTAGAKERNFVVIDDGTGNPEATSATAQSVATNDSVEKLLQLMKQPPTADREQKLQSLRSTLQASANGYSLLAQALNQRLGDREKYEEAATILKMMALFPDRDSETIAMAKSAIRLTDSPENLAAGDVTLGLPVTATEILIQKLPTAEAAQYSTVDAIVRHKNHNVRSAMARALIAKYPDTAPELRRQLEQQQIKDVSF